MCLLDIFTVIIQSLKGFFLCTWCLCVFCNWSDLNDVNETLNMEAGREARLSEGDTFTLANFSYSNSVIVQRMFHHLSSTDFIGITVSSHANSTKKK